MKTLSLRVEPELMERIENYAEDIDETKSTAARDLLLVGLEGRTDHADQLRDNATTGLLILGVFLVGGTADLSGAIYGVDLGTIGLGLLLGAVINDKTDALAGLYAQFTESREEDNSTDTN